MLSRSMPIGIMGAPDNRQLKRLGVTVRECDLVSTYAFTEVYKFSSLIIR